MTKLWKKARKLSGLARYERTNRRKTMEGGRLKLAYNVPGTKEAGDIHMLRAHTNDIYRRLQKKAPPLYRLRPGPNPHSPPLSPTSVDYLEMIGVEVPEEKGGRR